MIKYFKKDFASVYAAIKFVSDNKVPTWAIVIWYVIMLPFGLIAYPFVRIWNWWILRQLMKDL